MRLFCWVCLCLSMVLCLSCSAVEESQRPFQLFVDGGDFDAVPQVVRLSVEGLHQVPHSDVWLIRGELSSSSQSKLRVYEIPATVATKRVPLASWRDGERRIFANTERLELGERYSLVALGYGLLGELRVSESEEPWLTRLGQGTVPEGGWLVYCLGEGERREWELDAQLELDDTEFSDVEPGLVPGVGELHCVRIPVRTQLEGVFIPPARIGRYLLSPGIVRVEPPSTISLEKPKVALKACGSDLPVSWGNGCMGASDSVLRWTTTTKVLLLELEGPLELGAAPVVRHMLVQSETKNVQTWGPLLPETDYWLRVFEFEETSLAAGMVEAVDEFKFTSDAPAPRWVINEVLADPQGSEPESEWIELVNAGADEGSLFGLELADSSGSVALPDVKLSAGQYGLLVRTDFEFTEDMVPHSDSVPIVIPSLGQNGLKNSGERVELRDQHGNVLSSFPAKAGKAGQSVGRLSLWSSDEDSTQFVLHGPPGSSPGAENFFGL